MFTVVSLRAAFMALVLAGAGAACLFEVVT